MRDLARGNFKGNNSSKLKTLVRFIIIIMVIFALGALVKKYLPQSVTGGSSVSLADAPKGLTPVDEAGASEIIQKGVDLKTQTVRLRDVQYGGAAKGEATRSFGGGSFVLDVEVTLPETKGYLIEVWLADNAGNVREIDFMSCVQNVCSLDLKDTDKYSKYPHIWVTRELTKEDEMPEVHILEGSFE